MSAAVRSDWRAVPLPERMRGLDRDHRGFPIPFLVLRDPNGGANFTINDSRKRAQCLSRDLCPICGQKLFRGRWFIGGPLAAFHGSGAYIDPPTHRECGQYALRVCPYLAVRKYTGRIDDAGFDWSQHPNEGILVDNTMLPDRPAVFVSVMATRQRLVGDPLNPYLKPGRPYMAVEYWRHGEQISHDAAAPLLDAALAELTCKLKTGEIKPSAPRLIFRPENTSARGQG